MSGISLIENETTTIIESITDAFVSVDSKWRFTYVNARAEKIYGRSRETLIGRDFWEIFPEARNTIFEETYRAAMAKREPCSFEAFFKPLNESWFEINVYPRSDGGLSFYFRDITERKRFETLAEGQRNALEAALAGKPLGDILDMLTGAVEAQSGEGAIASILLLDADKGVLRDGAGTKLAAAYRAAIDGIAIGPGVGSCGTAAFNGKTTIVSDIAVDPLWKDFKDLALSHGLHACWSQPIHSGDGNVLGTFAVYYPFPRSPAENDIRMVEVLAGTAAVIIGRDREHRDRIAAQEQLRAADALLQREKRLYETILSATPDFIYTFDHSRRFTFANRALLEMWGKSWEEAVGKSFLEIGYEPWHAEMHEREIDQVIATKKPFRGEVHFTGTHGKRLYDYIFVPVFGRDGEVEAVAGTTRDVTDSRANEATLKASESRFRFLSDLETATRAIRDPMRIMEVATQMTSEYLNTSRCAYADVEPDGDHFTIRADYVADGSMSTAGYYSLALFGSKAVNDLNNSRTLVIRDVNTELTAEDGADMFREIGIHAIVTCPLVKEGRLHAMMAVHQNLPRDWQPEEIRLMEIVAERCWSSIERVRHEAMLVEADRKKDEFLATLAHELRNPLAPIRNALHIFQSPTAAPDTIERARELIGRQVTQMVRLVDDLMDISRITHGKIELRRDPVLLADIIHNAVETCQPLLTEKRHSLTLSLPESPVTVLGDAVRLGQVFANLLNNAGKYTEPGGDIRLSARVEGEQAIIDITDNGIGIAPQQLPHIFDMFTQADNSIERAQGGLGIGLTLVRNLVERHGGKVHASSEGEGRGTSVTIALPVHHHAAASAPAPSSPETAKGGSAVRVLVVDDNRDSAQTIGWAIEMLGHEARVLNDGAAAIAAAPAFRPDVVLLDIGMPGMSGYDVCTTMRSMPGMENTIFIAQTGWGQEEHRRRSRAAGFHHHLVKPLDFKELGKLIDGLPQAKTA
ncbi:MAG TPA: PAS domain-containing protein [Patescibacteria group bacterium]|nr:PAS domain-containing protein [Patescibacteria group bacterium]